MGYIFFIRWSLSISHGSKSGRVNARGSIQRIHLKTGIVCQRNHEREAFRKKGKNSPCLEQGISLQRLFCLLNFDVNANFVECQNCEKGRDRLKQRTKLFYLVAVSGCKDDGNTIVGS